MKKLINDPRSVVEEMIEGLVLISPGLAKLERENVIVRAEFANPGADRSRVALISGGGSGHEPAHAGFVGRGMLSAAVAGDVFTSPTPDAVFAAIKAVAGPAGALLIVKNYTGDRLNFGLAAERARLDGIPVELVLVHDDVALLDSVDHAGRRGLAGTILVHKIAGEASERGASLAEVAAEARAVAGSVRTMGVALTPCTVPAAGRPGFDLGPDEIELGLGIHGEPGVSRIPIETAGELVERLLGRILDDLDATSGIPVVLLVNNLGATPVMELAIVAREAARFLESRGLILERVYAGTFLSALEMAGVSLSVLRVDPSRLDLLDAPTEAPAWTTSSERPRLLVVPNTSSFPNESAPASTPKSPAGQALDSAVRRAVDALITAEARLTELDRATGDGDLGISLSRGSRAILEALPRLPRDDASETLRGLALTVQRAIGGTSGPLYAAGFLRASRLLDGVASPTPEDWARAFRGASEAISELGGAKAGDRTMLDALIPASEALEHSLQIGRAPLLALKDAASAAEASSQSTSTMLPRRGRSSYLGSRALGHPDPGAEAVSIWLRALSR